MWVSSSDLRRELKEQRKCDREAQREQNQLAQAFTKKARVSVARRLSIPKAKTLSQKEAAALLDCVIDNWLKKKTYLQD